MNQETALALLQTAAAESEEESEKLVRDFMDKEIDLESFLEQFLKSRKTMHLRKIKSEKMSELIRMSTTQTNRNSSFIPSSGFYPMSGGSVPYPTSTSVPYPLGPMPMPMPGMPRPYQDKTKRREIKKMNEITIDNQENLLKKVISEKLYIL